MQAPRKIFFRTILAVWVFSAVGCKKTKSAFDLQSEKIEREIQVKIAPLATRYHARVDWSKGLELKQDAAWTIEVEDAVKPRDGSPVVLVGDQEDVERRGSRYYIRVGFDAPWASLERVSVRAECSELIARRAAGVDRRVMPRVAIVVNVQSVVRPRFEVEGKIDAEGTADTAVVNGVGLAIEGACVDWLLLDDQN